jgi:hypothetical protein
VAVTLYLDIARTDNDQTEAQAVAQFWEKFQADNWPWTPVPEIYYYPRSLEKAGGSKRA